MAVHTCKVFSVLVHTHVILPCLHTLLHACTGLGMLTHACACLRDLLLLAHACARLHDLVMLPRAHACLQEPGHARTISWRSCTHSCMLARPSDVRAASCTLARGARPRTRVCTSSSPSPLRPDARDTGPRPRAGVYLQARLRRGGPRPIQLCTRGARRPQGPPQQPPPGGGPAAVGGRGKVFLGGFGVREGTQASQVPPANRVPSAAREEPPQSEGGLGLGSGPQGGSCPHPVLGVSPRWRVSPAAPAPASPGCCCHLFACPVPAARCHLGTGARPGALRASPACASGDVTFGDSVLRHHACPQPVPAAG